MLRSGREQPRNEGFGHRAYYVSQSQKDVASHPVETIRGPSI